MVRISEELYRNKQTKDKGSLEKNKEAKTLRDAKSLR